MRIGSTRHRQGRVRWIRPFLCLVVAVLGASVAAAAKLPADVTAFLDRRVNCDHWTGEEPYDAERRAEIEAAIRQFRCVTIERDEVRLRKLHAKNRAVVVALDKPSPL